MLISVARVLHRTDKKWEQTRKSQDGRCEKTSHPLFLMEMMMEKESIDELSLTPECVTPFNSGTMHKVSCPV